MADNRSHTMPDSSSSAFTCSLSVVLPCRNEETGVALTVREFASFCRDRFSDWEIVVVDDGSTDGTGAVLDGLSGEMGQDHLTVVRNPTGRGYGCAVIGGIGAARGSLVLLTDGDHQYRARDLESFLVAVESCEAVVGFRRRRAEGLARVFQSGLYSVLVRVLLGLKCRDVNCAFKLFRGDLLRGMPLVSRGFGIDAEILARAETTGARIEERPVEHHPRVGGASTVRACSVWATLLECLRIRRSLR